MAEPLTPADCDCRGLPFMPLDVVRLVDSDLFALTTGDEFKAAVALWCKAWVQMPAASLPDDDRVLAHLSGAGARWRKVKAMALRGWVKCDDGRLYHPVVAEKAREAYQHRLAQRERARRRWPKEEPPAMPEDDAPAMPRDSHGISHGNARDSKGTGKGEKTVDTPRVIVNPEEIKTSKGFCEDARENPVDVALRRKPAPALKPQARADADMADALIEERAASDRGEAWAAIMAARDPKDPQHIPARKLCEDLSKRRRLGWFADEARH